MTTLTPERHHVRIGHTHFLRHRAPAQVASCCVMVVDGTTLTVIGVTS